MTIIILIHHHYYRCHHTSLSLKSTSLPIQLQLAMAATRTVIMACLLCLASCQEPIADTPLATSQGLPSLRQAAGEDSADALDQEGSLSRMLVAMVTRDLTRCSLLLAYNGDFGNSGVLRNVMALSNTRQVRKGKKQTNKRVI